MRKTSPLGWRIVAGGLFFFIFGGSLVMNHTGPTWIGGVMLIIGIVLALAGRQV